MYPEGHVIRLFETILKTDFNIQNWNLLDFGCGNGTHMNYFQSKGINSYGVDISSKAIENGIKNNPELKDKLKLKDSNQSLADTFKGMKFNIIFSNQTLYYLDEKALKTNLEEMSEILADHGIVYFTMISKEHYLYKLSSPISNSQLRRVKHTSRVAEDTEVLFINSKEHLKELFSNFEPYFIGSYDTQMKEGSRKHYQFLGIKK